MKLKFMVTFTELGEFFLLLSGNFDSKYLLVNSPSGFILETFTSLSVVDNISHSRIKKFT